MNELTILDMASVEVRTVYIDGEPWFVAKDVCRVLDLNKYRDAVARLKAKDKGVAILDTPGGKQCMSVISEPGLYRLIFRSRKPEAQRFADWICDEVLPSIRKYGYYMTPAKAEEILADQNQLTDIVQYCKSLMDKRQNRGLYPMDVQTGLLDNTDKSSQTWARQIGYNPSVDYQDLVIDIT